MKKISTVFILLFTMNSWATDYKTCVLKEVKLQLEHKDACEMANLKKSVAKVNEAYSKCGLRTLENSPSTPDINVVNTIANAKYDDEIEKSINEKIIACGFKGKATVKDKGLSGSVEILEITQDKGGNKARPAAH